MNIFSHFALKSDPELNPDPVFFNEPDPGEKTRILIPVVYGVVEMELKLSFGCIIYRYFQFIFYSKLQLD